MSMFADEKKVNESRAVANATDAKIEKHFKSHPELPNGRDYRFNHTRNAEEDKKFRANFDGIFPNSPGVGI